MLIDSQDELLVLFTVSHPTIAELINSSSYKLKSFMFLLSEIYALSHIKLIIRFLKYSNSINDHVSSYIALIID